MEQLVWSAYDMPWVALQGRAERGKPVKHGDHAGSRGEPRSACTPRLGAGLATRRWARNAGERDYFMYDS
jgi:hypothetical protein